MSNRKTIYHWNVGGSPHWYDMLATMGQYVRTKFHLPSLNMALFYNPGTIVAIARKVLPHGVDSVEMGDRVCFTWSFREDVQKYLEILKETLSTMEAIMSS